MPLLIIWGAQCASIVIFIIVAKLGVPPATEPIDPVMVYTLVPLGIATSLAGVILPPPFRKQPAQTAWILGMAFVEACAIYGLVLHILGGTLAGTALMSWAFLLQMSQVPVPDRVQAWDARRG